MRRLWANWIKAESKWGCLTPLILLGLLVGALITPFAILITVTVLLGTDTTSSAIAAIPPPAAVSDTASSGDTTPPDAPTEEPATDTTTVTLDYDLAMVAAGETTFATLCAVCHGPDALGLPGLGLDLVNSEFVSGMDDQELLDFVNTGRLVGDAANTTGVDMLPKGGNPALTDEDVLNVIAYIRTLAGNIAP